MAYENGVLCFSTENYSSTDPTKGICFGACVHWLDDMYKNGNLYDGLANDNPNEIEAIRPRATAIQEQFEKLDPEYGGSYKIEAILQKKNPNFVVVNSPEDEQISLKKIWGRADKIQDALRPIWSKSESLNKVSCILLLGAEGEQAHAIGLFNDALVSYLYDINHGYYIYTSLDDIVTDLGKNVSKDGYYEAYLDGTLQIHEIEIKTS